jgi:serine/threonine-protein kinase
MARVYLAESLSSGIRKLVVLKVLNPEFCADAEMRASFRREAELSAQLYHPNVVQVMAVEEYAGTPLMVMEYLDGVPLSFLMKHVGTTLPLRLYLQILSQVLAGLHHFHELKDLDGSPLNTVHRDVSPQNVMVLHDGPVKILDFGVAKVNAAKDLVTRAGLIKGKLQYMPPEQLLGEMAVDRRADLFSIGVILWEAIADRRMWDGYTEIQIVKSLASGKVPQLVDFAPDTPESVLEIVRCATEIEREDRFSTALEMQTAIEHAMTYEGWTVQPRELANFMSQRFGLYRREQETKIKNAMLAIPGHDSSPIVESTTPIRFRREEELDPPTVHSSGIAISRKKPSEKRRILGFATVAAIAMLTSIWLFNKKLSSDEPVALQEAAQIVTFEVEVSPREAEILLDGKVLGKGRFIGQLPSSGDVTVLELKAPGYKTERREVVFRKDLTLHTVLEPKTEPLSVREPPTGVSTHSAGFQSNALIATKDLRSHKSATKSIATSTKSNRKCNPPYTFSADGVKTFKPECF